MDTLSFTHSITSAFNLETILCSTIQSLVLETAVLAQKSLLSLLLLMRSRPDYIHMVPSLTAIDKRFPFSELSRLEKPSTECKDADETDEDDSDDGDVEGDDQDDDDESGGEEGSDDDDEDSDGDGNFDGESDDDDDDDDGDEDDDDDNDDEEDGDEDGDEDEEEEKLPPLKRKK